MKFKALIALLLCNLLYGCSSHAPRSTPLSDNVQFYSPVSQALLEQHKRWEGTPYSLGGSSRAGVDCSAFTQITYKEQFGVDIPRTTQAQLQIGTPVSRQALSPGDLVFFRTGGAKQRHVGVYLEQGIFLHASTSRGVILSRLDNPYWQQHYWTAVRPGGLR